MRYLRLVRVSIMDASLYVDAISKDSKDELFTLLFDSGEFWTSLHSNEGIKRMYDYTALLDKYNAKRTCILWGKDWGKDVYHNPITLDDLHVDITEIVGCHYDKKRKGK